MSEPAPPPEPPAAAVPYGGPVTPYDANTAAASVTPENLARGVGRAAATWGARAIVFFILRAVFRALFRR